MNFLLREMTFLRYFYPLAKKYGKKCRFFIGQCGKYNCPTMPKNRKSLEKICKKLDAEILPIEKLKDYPGLTFLIEGCLSNYLTEKHVSVSLTYMTDYRGSYEKYINDVDYVVFPNKKFAEFYNTISDKNLYLGSPKYDVTYNKKDIYDFYNLEDKNNYALLVYPKHRDLPKTYIPETISSLRELGFTPIIKHRGKESVINSYGCRTFSDESWMPHTTLDLLHISDVVINHGSTTIKEAIMLEKPVINFDVKPHKHLAFLYDFKFVKEFKETKFDKKIFEYFIKDFVLLDHGDEFKICKDLFLFKPDSSGRILEYFN